MDYSVVLVLIMLSVRNISSNLTRGTCDWSYVKCQAGYKWRSPSNSLCILETHLCDGDLDCTDGSDEIYCGNSEVGFRHKFVQGPCPTDYALCITGTHRHLGGLTDNRCIPQSWICNDLKDCNDGSDEHYCPYDSETGFQFTFKQGSCPDNYFQCRTGETKPQILSKKYDCIAKSWICDGFPDCKDEFDEIYCPHFPTTTTIASNTSLASQTITSGLDISPMTEQQADTTPEVLETTTPISTKTQNQETIHDTVTCSQWVSAFTLGVTLINTILIVFLIIASWRYRKYKNSQQYLNLCNMTHVPLLESQNTNITI